MGTLGRTIFDRWWIAQIYIVLTLITCVQAMFNSSFSVGGAALVACALSYFGTAGFVGSFLARREKKSTTPELLGIATIAVVLAAAGIALISWSGFRVGLFGVTINGPLWALTGVAVALVTTKKKHAM